MWKGSVLPTHNRHFIYSFFVCFGPLHLGITPGSDQETYMVPNMRPVSDACKASILCTIVLASLYILLRVLLEEKNL